MGKTNTCTACFSNYFITPQSMLYASRVKTQSLPKEFKRERHKAASGPSEREPFLNNTIESMIEP